MSSRQQEPPPALIAEATKRAGLIWVKAPGAGPARPAWHVWHEGAAYLLTGPGEQPLPSIAGGDRVTVLVPSKDSRGLLVTWEAEAGSVEPGGAEWAQVAGLLAAGRLNGEAAPGGDPPTARWAAGCAVYRLRPAGAARRQALAQPLPAVHPRRPSFLGGIATHCGGL